MRRGGGEGKRHVSRFFPRPGLAVFVSAKRIDKKKKGRKGEGGEKGGSRWKDYPAEIYYIISFLSPASEEGRRKKKGRGKEGGGGEDHKAGKKIRIV